MDEAMTVAFLHTVTTLPAVFNELADELIPGVERFHMVDESLLIDTRKAGVLTQATRGRVWRHLDSAVEAGADLVVVTCSSIGPAVDESSAHALRIDEPMADEAVRIGNRVGVLATLATTLEPTAQLIARKGDVTVVSHLCEGAFEALQAGDRDRHDELVRAGVRELSASADVVVLAQASMARVTDALDSPVPILASPRLGMLRVAELVQGSS
jgi:aspartate/glutamate racemase